MKGRERWGERMRERGEGRERRQGEGGGERMGERGEGRERRQGEGGGERRESKDASKFV